MTSFTKELGQADSSPDGRSGAAAIRAAVDSVAEGGSIADALMLVKAADVEAVLHRQFDGNGTPIATGLGVSPGAAVGAVCFSPDDAVDIYDSGVDIILVKDETSPEDVHGMAIAEGILTTRGGMASHAAVVARGWGKPAVCGAEAISIDSDSFTVGDLVVKSGDIISLDGASGDVFVGAVDTETNDDDVPELERLLAWADEVRAGKLGVRANADTAEDAERARAFGAEGIGLCRTEHQFLGSRLSHIRHIILAHNPQEEQDALAALESLQKEDFLGLLKAMDGLPVTVRLLDPPLHEFLPSLEDLSISDALGELDEEGRELLQAARQWHETNPMLGTRGVRLGIIRQGLYRIQIQALLEAAAEVQQAGGQPHVEIMIPFTVNRAELDLVGQWIAEELERVNANLDQPVDAIVGTMIETPRSALCAGQLAEASDFFSFGTNDLTQMVFGFSRDDVESRVGPAYREHGLMPSNPFESIDVEGVGRLMEWAAKAGRETNPEIKLGLCGEHGGDPASIEFCQAIGLDYVSCSPFRVPVARLAAAQAVLRSQEHEGSSR